MKLINFIPLLYVPVCIVFAYSDSIRIKKGKHINHGYNAIVHIITALAFAYWSRWINAAVTLIVARIVFDSSLNYFRHGRKYIGHVSPEVAGYAGIIHAFKNGKVLDYLEYRVFGFDGITPKVIYSATAIILMFI